jgi:hypothetical protein
VAFHTPSCRYQARLLVASSEWLFLRCLCRCFSDSNLGRSQVEILLGRNAGSNDITWRSTNFPQACCLLPSYHFYQVCGASTLSSASGVALFFSGLNQIDFRVRHASRSKNKGAWELPTLLGEQTRRKFPMQDIFIAMSLIGL